MGVVNIVKTIKEVHKSCMVLVKIGSFYNVYSKDAYIVSYLFKYKIKEQENVPMCSFPVTSISKIENILEKNKINYLIVDKRSNYEVEQKAINKQENNYDKVFKNAEKIVNTRLRIQKIYDFLLKNSENHQINEKLQEIESVLQKV